MEFKIAALLLVNPGSENMALNMWLVNTALQAKLIPPPREASLTSPSPPTKPPAEPKWILEKQEQEISST